jgi:hypothetical protein
METVMPDPTQAALDDYRQRINYLLRFYATDCDATSDKQGSAVIHEISFNEADIEKVITKLAVMMNAERTTK